MTVQRHLLFDPKTLHQGAATKENRYSAYKANLREAIRVAEDHVLTPSHHAEDGTMPSVTLWADKEDVKEVIAEQEENARSLYISCRKRAAQATEKGLNIGTITEQPLQIKTEDILDYSGKVIEGLQHFILPVSFRGHGETQANKEGHITLRDSDDLQIMQQNMVIFQKKRKKQ